MMLSSAPGWPWHRRAGHRWAEIAEFAAALALSAYVVVLVREQSGDVAACVAATAMTLPVAFARRAPLAAAGVLAASAATAHWSWLAYSSQPSFSACTTRSWARPRSP